MILELADAGSRRKKIRVRDYDRRANHVPAYYRRALKESSLFSIRLNDCGTIYLVVPDPENIQKPRKVNVEIFDVLNEDEFCKLVDYVREFNPPSVIDDTIVRYMTGELADDEENPLPADPTAGEVIDHIYAHPDGEESFWDQETFGISNKIAVPVGLLIAYKMLS